MVITINGKECTCEKGEYLLDIARRNGIEIPTLCNHAAFEEGQGCCRMCVVEITDARGRSQIVVSCVYPVEREITVNTESDRVVRHRRMILTLLSKRAPESAEIKALCEKYGAKDIARFVTADNEKCIMCGLCAKACATLSVGAISTVNRGITKAVSTPYGEASSVCVGCAACAEVCPTGAIEMTEDENTRTIWNKQFTLVHCENCGAVIGTKEQIEYAAKSSGNDPDTLCDDCRRIRIASEFARNY